jgi:hypothetical protein
MRGSSSQAHGMWFVVPLTPTVRRASSCLMAQRPRQTETPTHSGAGRIATVRMRPLSLAERGLTPPTVNLARLLGGRRPTLTGETAMSLADYAAEIVASGFPAIRGLPGRALRAQLDGYLARIVAHDFDELGHRVRNEGALRRWMTAYAAATSTTASFEVIRDAASSGEGNTPAKSTTIPYRVEGRSELVGVSRTCVPLRRAPSRPSAVHLPVIECSPHRSLRPRYCQEII